MANADRPSGLSPIGFLSGAPWNGKGRVYCIPDTDDTNIFAVGDPVTLAGSADSNGVPTITLATAGTGNLVLGAIISGAGAPKYGASFGIPAESPVVIPASKSRAYYVLVADDPDTIFEIQEVSGGTALTATEVGLNANLVSGVNNGYVSGWEVDNSGEGTGSTIQLKLLRLRQKVDNAFGEHAKWEVLINHHVFKAGSTGI